MLNPAVFNSLAVYPFVALSLSKEALLIPVQPEKQPAVNVGLFVKESEVIVVMFWNAFAAIVAIPELTINVTTLASTVKIAFVPLPIVNMETPASDVGIVREFNVEPVTLVIPVRTFTFEIL